MWKRPIFPENTHSDMSISDDEELDDDWPENCVSLGGLAEKKEGLRIQSQLEILRGTHSLNHATKASSSSARQMQTGFSYEDEVKRSIFYNEGDSICCPKKSFTCNSDEEMISDDEENSVLSKYSIIHGLEESKVLQRGNLPSIGSERQSGSFSGSKEARALACVNADARCSTFNAASSKANTLARGGGGKVKPKFSFHFQSHKEVIPWSPIPKDEKDLSQKVQHAPEGLEDIEPVTEEHTMPNLLEDFQGERAKDSEIHDVPIELQSIEHNFAEHSMTELLDGLLNKTGQQCSSPKTIKNEKRVQVATKKSILSLGGRTIDDEDPPELVGSGTSSDDEAGNQNLKLVIPEIRRQSMADRFQDALGSSSVNEGPFFAAPKSLGVGLFRQLQLVLQSEKQREMDFSLEVTSRSLPE